MYILNWSPVSFLGKSYCGLLRVYNRLKNVVSPQVLNYIRFFYFISSMYSIGKGVSPQTIDLI